MTIAFKSLPLGFRFHPTDEELVNHYLKPKITGRSTSEVEVVAEIDVCKCEPWDLPDKSIIRSDDPEWFFFAPKDRKYPNGHRSNRATEKGYWKATGTDRIIRSKPSSEKSIIIGMKKTLVFHRGRAPKGIRTNWIMHEYRTTEHEFESGDQGGYVLYRLFKKPEEKSSTSSTDAMVTNGFCPSPTKSCPSDSHEADAMDETEIMLTHHSPMSDTWEKPKSSADYGQNQPVGINSWLASEAYSTSLLVEQEKKCSIMVSPDEASRVKEKADPLQDVLVHELDCEQIDSDVFPNVSRPLPPYADDYLIGNANQKLRTGSYPVNNANNAGGDALDAYLISALSCVDSCSGASVFPKDPSDGIFLKHTSWDSASYKDSGCSSDIDTESGLPPDAGLEAFDCPGRSLLPPDSIQMDNSVLYPEIKTQLSTLYENASLLPYDINGPDVYSVDSGAESLQELFSSLEELNNHRTSDNNNVFEGTGIKLRSRQVQQEQSNSELNQGNAARRICLQHSIGKAPLGAVQFESTSGDDNESKKSIDNVERELYCMAKSTSEINTMSNRDDPVEIGMSLRTQRLLHSPNGSFTRHDETSTNVSSPEEHQSHNELSIRNSSDGKSEPKAAGEHIGDKIYVVGDSPPRAILDKVEGLSIHDSDDTPNSSNNCQMHRSVLRLRKNSANDNTLKDSPYSNATGCDSVVDCMFLFSCLLLSLLCVGIWRCINSGAL